jgi:HK97 family phage prohead protease
MRDELEIRTWSGQEARAEVTDAGRIRGYAIVFRALSLDLGGFREMIAPEAVERTIREGTDVRALFNHNVDEKPLGRVKAGTLALSTDRRGLRIEIDPPSWASGIVESIKRGDLDGMSFAFKALHDEWDLTATPPIRTVTDMEIREVSIVNFPAYPQTSVAVAQRSLQAHQEAQRHSRIAWLRKELKNALAR